MSSSEFSKNTTISDSNIPVPKRTHAATKRPRGCAQLPELQKYIETIIKASNECDSEDALLSEKANRFPRERKFGKYSVYKGNDNTAKHEKVKFDLRVSARKSKNRTKTPFTEAVSNGGEISSTFVDDFEDPRNWKTDDTQNLASKSEIENFLKQLFPNPYHLGNVNDVQNVNSDISPEKKEKDDDLRDETLADVPISNVHTETEAESEKTDNAFVTVTSVRESKVSGSTGPVSFVENHNRPASRMGGCRESIPSFGCIAKRVSTPTKTPPRNKSSHSTINISSRTSSLESVSEVSSSHSRTIISRTKTFRLNCNLVSRKNSSNEMKQESSGESFLEGRASYNDIGKLKMLTESDDYFTKNFDQDKDEREDHSKHTSSTAFGDECESNDLSDLRQVFEVMNQETERSFVFGVQSEQSAMTDTPKDPTGGDKLLQLINELTGGEMETQEGIEDERLAQQDEWAKKRVECCVALEETQTGREKGENDFEDNTQNAEQEGNVESSLTDVLLKEENLKNIESEKREEEKTREDSWREEEEKQEESSRQEKDINSPLTLGDLERVLLTEEEEEQDAGQKIDEVLQFMYDCLKKFTSQEKKHTEEAETFLLEDKKEIKKSKEDLTNVTHAESPHLADENCTAGAEDPADSSFVESYPRVKEIQSESSTILYENKRKPIMRARSRKKQDKNSPLAVPAVPPPASRISVTTRHLEMHSVADFAGVDSQNIIQTVEGQNELGSYSENVPVLPPVECTDSQGVKSILPHSVKLKKSKTDTQKTIKDVLDTEEKLLANYLRSKPTEKKLMEKSVDSKGRKQGNNVVVRNSRNGAYPFLQDYKRSNSNFVICVSSLPRSLRTMGANRTSLTLSPSLSLSLREVSKIWDLKQLPYYHKLPLKKIPVISDVARSVLEYTYNVSQGALVTVGKSSVKFIASLVYLKRTVGYTRSEEVPLRNSECLLSIRVKPIKKSLFVESSGTSSCLIKPLGGGSSDLTDGGTSTETEGNQRVNSLLEALEKTEGRLMVLEQNECIASESLSSSFSGNETYKCDTSEIDWEGESGHERVHDLLLRTYNLQHKLHRYLYKMTCVQSTPTPSSVAQQQQQQRSRSEDQTDLGVVPEVRTGKQEKAGKAVVEEVRTVEVQTSDLAAIYSSPPPSEEKQKAIENQTEPQTNGDVEEQNQNEDDDNSSVCSFKSSNDFSESNEITNLEKLTSPEKEKSGEFLKKIFSEIESFRQCFKAVKREDPSAGSNHNNSEDLKDNTLTEFDPKMPAKGLRTVFKGKKSLTELTIGLKDVPMTQVSNISVEKRKFSANHTKISICILKERPEILEKANKVRESMLKQSTNALRNKFSTLYFDNIRPSLSRCRTEYSRLEDDLSKTSESIQESSEDDDDEYKSVGSSPSSPDVSNEQTETKDNKPAVPPPPKTFTKYRFDFYRKMDMSLDSSHPKPKPKSNSLSSTICRYKELEPLKQALTEMQIRMRSIKQDALYSGNDYYERALKLAKMSAGYCQSCGNRAVIPKDTFGYYKTLLPRRHSNHRHGRHFKMSATPNPSYYSFRSSNPELNANFCDLDYKHSSSYLLNHTTRPGGAFLRNSLHDVPILI